ncbi:hypothetical protein [Halolamina salina]|uniref:Uncharacterized protein n=1 Tax=Halolamina salina TaxID=1220023 RepID=A0ABD6B361_9EURY
MPRDQFLPPALLLLFTLLVALPAYGLYTGDIAVLWTSLLLGGALFVWKWRWWWTPIQKYVQPGANEP